MSINLDNITNLTACKAFLYQKMLTYSLGNYGGVEISTPGGSYSFYIGDFYMIARAFPEYWNATRLAAAINFIASHIPSDPQAPHYQMPPQIIYNLGGGSFSLDWALESPAYYALLVALCHNRGHRTIYTLHKTAVDAALAAAPRTGAGLIDGETGSGRQWGFEDGEGISGGNTILSCHWAWAFQDLKAIAVSKGDTTSAAAYQDGVDALIVGLQGVRRTDHFYKPSISEDIRGVFHSSMVVMLNLCTPSERADTANALIDEYTAVGGSTITYHGQVRHIVEPDYYGNSFVVDGQYSNGGFWSGPWVSWLAKVFEYADRADLAEQLLQEQVDEIFRQDSIGEAPWEWCKRGDTGVSTAYYKDEPEIPWAGAVTNFVTSAGFLEIIPLPLPPPIPPLSDVTQEHEVTLTDIDDNPLTVTNIYGTPLE